MPVDILQQLRTLREGVAEALRKDPRYLTLAALDKSIAEITSVLASSGLMAPDAATPLTPFQIEPSAPAAAPGALSSSAYASAGQGESGKTVDKTSALQALAGTASGLAAGGLGAAAIAGTHKTGERAPATRRPDREDAESADDSEGDLAGETHADADEADHADAPPGEFGDDEGAQSAEHAHEQGDPAADPAGVVPAGRGSGYIPMQAKPDAKPYEPSIYVKFGKPPAKVDLRSLMTPIENQGPTESCVANAVAGAYQYWIKRTTKQDQDISRLFIYYNARWRDGSQDVDEGSVIQLAMEGLATFGACFESDWPFDPHLILKKPGADAYKDGATHRIQDMAQVPLKLETWKQALAEGRPIVFGCALFDSFDECSERGGVVPMPSPDDVVHAEHGGHSMCAVGYNDGEKVFIVRNSWGTEWGDKGYCYMPYDYLVNPKFNFGDCWVFVPKTPSQPPREVWSDTTDPVTNDGKGVDFEISEFSVADYDHVAVDLFEHVLRPFNTRIPEDYGEYVDKVGKGLWAELDRFDVRTFLASTAALTGVATALSESFLSELSTSLTETGSQSEENSEHGDHSDHAGRGDD